MFERLHFLMGFENAIYAIMEDPEAVAKHIAALSATVNGEVDAIILTGGIANSEKFTKMVSDRVKFIAPVVIYAG